MLLFITLYLIISFMVSIALIWRGLNKLDPSIPKGNWALRLFLLPGCLIFWPYLLHRWVKKIPLPKEKSAHRNLSKLP